MVFKALIFISLALGTVGQLLMKKGTGQSDLKRKDMFKRIFQLLLNGYVIAGISVFALSAILWIIMLNKVELSYAYPLVSLTYIFIALFSMLLFKEKVSKMRWLSIIIIVFGVILVTLS